MKILQDKLSSIFPASRVHTRLIDRIAYANDASYFHLVPQAVVQPNSIGEIQSLFKFSQQQRTPMTFRAAGTSLSGQAVTDGILVDISKHWDRYSVEEGGTLLRAQTGIVGGFLNNVLKPYGRRIGPDPASLDACMLGGILANNSSGMCCGVTENSYQTIHSMTFVLPNGFVLDTAAPNAHQIFENEQPHIAQGLLELKRRLLEAEYVPHPHPSPSGRGAIAASFLSSRERAEGEGETLAERVRRRYQMKNNNGYLLNAFVDFDRPLDILVHLLIGSEGRWGSSPRPSCIPCLNFRTSTPACCISIPCGMRPRLFSRCESRGRARQKSWTGPRSVQWKQFRACQRSCGNYLGVRRPFLVEYQAADAETLLHFQKESARTLKTLRLLHDPEFTQDPVQQANLWKPRKGIIASVGAMRAPGTTSLIEDVAFPVPRLADAVTDLQALFAAHGYPEGVIYGHAKDGNLHFQINQSFNTQDEIDRFDGFVQELVQVVSGKYDGALKAEHGTGRNMAPFVEMEWGAEAYGIMRDLKSLLDPDGMLSPGVVINPNPQAHVTDVKTIAAVSPIVDACIECGFLRIEMPIQTPDPDPASADRCAAGNCPFKESQRLGRPAACPERSRRACFPYRRLRLRWH